KKPEALPTKIEPAEPADRPAEVTAVAFSGDRKTFAAGSSDGTVRIWRSDSLRGAPVTTLRLEPFGKLSISSVAFGANGEGVLLAAGGSDGNILVWNLTDLNRQPRLLSGNGEPITAVAFGTHGRLASGSQDGTILIWLDPVNDSTSRRLGTHSA